MRRRLLATASIAMLARAAPALATPDAPAPAPAASQVEEVTITATRTPTKVIDAPATVSVITDRQIDDQLVKDIKDLVRYEPGVAVRHSPARFTLAGASTGRDNNSGFNIRGLEGNRVLIQVDGIRVPEGFSFGAQAAGRGDYVDLDLLKSVEILRGPASALYGSDGVAGAVSFITRDPLDMLAEGQSYGGRVKVGYDSSDDSHSEGFVAAGRTGPWSALLSYTRRDGHALETNGSNISANTDRTVADPQDTLSNAILGKLVYAPDDRNRFRLTYDHQDEVIETDVLSAIAKPPLSATSTRDLRTHDALTRDRVSLDYHFREAAGLVREVDAAVYHQTSDNKQDGAERRNTAAPRTRINLFDTDLYGVNLQGVSLAQTGPLTHRFVYGGDASVTKQKSLRDGTVPPVGETFPTRAFPTTDYTLAGAFLQDEIGIGDGRLTLYPAVRLDYYDLDPHADALLTTLTPRGQNDTHVSPKFSAVFKATPQVGVFFNYANGYKAPSPSQVNNAFANLVANYRSIPNADLKPETSETFEGGVRLQLPFATASVTGFTGDYDDFIDQVQTTGAFTPTNPAIFQFINIGHVTISGVEATGEARLGRGFSLHAAFSYAKGDATSRGVKTPLASVEPYKLVGGLGYQDPGGRFGGQLIATHSDGKALSRAGSTCTPSCYVPPAFTTLDATAWLAITPAAILRIGVFNLTDRTYVWWSDVRGLASTSPVIDAYSQPGRNVGVSLAYRF